VPEKTLEQHLDEILELKGRISLNGSGKIHIDGMIEPQVFNHPISYEIKCFLADKGYLCFKDRSSISANLRDSSRTYFFANSNDRNSENPKTSLTVELSYVAGRDGTGRACIVVKNGKTGQDVG
jgi:hypothetical protein